MIGTPVKIETPAQGRAKDYGMKTFKLAAGIDEAEGRLLLDVLKLSPQFKEANFAV